MGVELRSRRRWKQATSSTCRERERERERGRDGGCVCGRGGVFAATHQRGFAGVGIAHDGHRRQRHLGAARAVLLPMDAHRLQLHPVEWMRIKRQRVFVTSS